MLRRNGGVLPSLGGCDLRQWLEDWKDPVMTPDQLRKRLEGCYVTIPTPFFPMKALAICTSSWRCLVAARVVIDRMRL